MIIIKDNETIEKMRRAGSALAEVFSGIKSLIRPGVSTLEIDSLIEQELTKRNLISQSKGYMGYKHATCISLNDEVVHGVPSKKRLLKEGDLIKIDICASLDGYCADMTRMFVV